MWSATNPVAHQVVNHYDADQRVAFTVDGNNNRTGYSYDPAGQLAATLHPDGTAVHQGYDAGGNLAWETAPARARAFDDFNRANEALGTAPTGRPWVVEAGTPVIDTNTWKASANDFPRAVINAGTPDGTVRTKFTTSPTAASSQGGIILRSIDTNDMLFVFFDDGGDVISLSRQDNGVNTTLATATQAFAAAQSYTIQVTLVGASITVSVDGVQRIAHTLSGADQTKFGGATKFGLQAATWNSEFRQDPLRRLLGVAPGR